jgi:hypothetical protein
LPLGQTAVEIVRFVLPEIEYIFRVGFCGSHFLFPFILSGCALSLYSL